MVQVHSLSPNGRVFQSALNLVLKTSGAEMLGDRHLTLSPNERKILRITTKQYINLILQKKNMTQAELLRKIKSIEPENADKMHIEHLNEAINNRMIPIWAYRIERALDLEKGTLLKLYKGRKE